MGKLHFPEQYPYKPPAVYMCTPQGRFKCNQKLCLSMSDFHPESWNPLWSVSAVLTGLLSFMLGAEDTVGSVQTSLQQKCKLARASHQFNRHDKVFQELFLEFVRESPPSTPASSNQSTLLLQTDRLPNSSVRRPRRRTADNESESLLSLVIWLFVFVALIFAVFKFIVGTSS